MLTSNLVAIRKFFEAITCSVYFEHYSATTLKSKLSNSLTITLPIPAFLSKNTAR
jgi:hypothetical protein